MREARDGVEGIGRDRRKSRNETRDRRVEETAELLQIEDKLDVTPDQMSGGQQQRVALGRSLAREPDVTLFDEPLSSLDQRLRLRMRTELRRIQQETGTTFVHVTHNQEDAMTIADEILLINEGEIEQFARPLELYHTPANEFVADFIGSPSMNIFKARFDSETVAFEIGDETSLAMPNDWHQHFLDRLDDGPVQIGLRPESLTVRADGRADGPVVDGRVSVIETFGDFNWYYLETPMGEELVVQSNDRDVLQALSVGDDVAVTVSPDSIHTFDVRTGESLGTARLDDDRRIEENRFTT